MTCLKRLECDSDTGFKREADADGDVDGKAARGANFLRMGIPARVAGRAATSTQTAKQLPRKEVCHFLDCAVGTVKVALRSTFTAEIHGVISTADQAICLSTTLHEIERGPLGPREAMRLADEAGLAFDIIVSTDAKNLLLALGTAYLKKPAEKNFLVHLMWLKSKLENDGKNQYNSMLEKASLQIETEKQKALSEIKNTVVDIALKASEKVIKRNLNNDDNKKMIEDTVDEFKSGK